MAKDKNDVKLSGTSDNRGSAEIADQAGTAPASLAAADTPRGTIRAGMLPAILLALAAASGCVAAATPSKPGEGAPQATSPEVGPRPPTPSAAEAGPPPEEGFPKVSNPFHVLPESLIKGKSYKTLTQLRAETVGELEIREGDLIEEKVTVEVPERITVNDGGKVTVKFIASTPDKGQVKFAVEVTEKQAEHLNNSNGIPVTVKVMITDPKGPTAVLHRIEFDQSRINPPDPNKLDLSCRVHLEGRIIAIDPVETLDARMSCLTILTPDGRKVSCLVADTLRINVKGKAVVIRTGQTVRVMGIVDRDARVRGIIAEDLGRKVVLAQGVEFAD